MADTATTRPVRASSAAPRWQRLVRATSFTATWSGFITRTKRLGAVGGGQRASWTSAAVAPGAARSAQVARMPRRRGTRWGVKEMGPHAAGEAGHGLLDLRDVLVAADAVGAQVLVHLAEGVLLAGLAAGAGDAAHGRATAMPSAAHQAGADERRERQRDGGGVAARVGDEAWRRAAPRGRARAGRSGPRPAAARRGVVEAVPARVGGRVVRGGRRPRGPPPRRRGRGARGASASETSAGRGQEGHLGGERRGLGLRQVAERGGRAGERRGGRRRPRPAQRSEKSGGEPEARVAGDDPGQLEAGVAGGARRWRRCGYAWSCMNMQSGAAVNPARRAGHRPADWPSGVAGSGARGSRRWPLHGPVAAVDARLGEGRRAGRREPKAEGPFGTPKSPRMPSIVTGVPRRGLEPPRPCDRQTLNLVRLPIPPPGRGAPPCMRGSPECQGVVL